MNVRFYYIITFTIQVYLEEIFIKTNGIPILNCAVQNEKTILTAKVI